MNTAKNECDCIFCKEELPIELPKTLITEIFNNNVVIFAGAGISTENKNVLNYSFYEDIASKCDSEEKNLSFPELMEIYTQKPNGRIKLLSDFKDRIQYIRSFPELYRIATRFHCELATLPHIDTIITTNWDTFFEEKCSCIPFVMSEDLAFWESSGRKVLKIHGSINNYGSIIATTSDYDKCKDILTSGLIGSVLKTIIATKTIIYVGYSFRDDDLDYIFKFIRDEMKNLHRTSFFVTPHETPEEFLDNYGMIHICTDGTYFISELKKHAWCNKILIPDSIYEIGDCLLSEMRIEHKKLHENYNCYDNPEVILCSSYQDGVIHALERMQFLRSTGEYSDQHKISGVFNAYNPIRKEKLKQKRYEDVAYIDGYQSALGFILLIGHGNFKRPFPKYYIYGIKRDTINFSDYKKTVPNMHEYHKGAYSRIKRLIREQTKYGSKVEFHHRPIL